MKKSITPLNKALLIGALVTVAFLVMDYLMLSF